MPHLHRGLSLQALSLLTGASDRGRIDKPIVSWRDGITFQLQKLLSVVILLTMARLLAHGQDAVTTIQLPDGKTTQLTFTTIDVPGAAVTSVQGINSAGDMAGGYGATNSCPTHGFVIRGGSLSSFDYPGSDCTVGTDINDSGLVVGYAEFLEGLVVHGFLYDGQAFTTLDIPHQPQTYPAGVNNATQVVGTAGASGSRTRPFELDGGKFRLLRVPGENQVACGINNSGKIVGFIPYPSSSKGFVYAAGVAKPIVFPGAQSTEAWGINDNGVIVGWYSIGTLVYGFALTGGQYISFSYPGAKYTFAFGINSNGQIVGGYAFDSTTSHGFVTSPITGARSPKSGN